MRIAVLGAGAMGSWFGGLLALHKIDVQLLTTNAEHRKAINDNGLVLKDSNRERHVSVTAHRPQDIQAPVDLVLLMTKTFQTNTAMESITHAIDANTHVLSLQNGLGNAENIAKHLPLQRVWVGVTMIPIDKLGAGVVAGKGHGGSYFGNAANKNDQPMAQQIESSFQAAGIELEHDANIYQRIWEKVAFNAGMNALSALSHGRPKHIAASPGSIELVKEVAAEAASIAKLQNVDIDLQRVYDMIQLSTTQHGDHIPSMLQDIESGRRTEVDALSGAIADIAKRHNAPARVNATLTTLVRLAELSHLDKT